MEGQEAYQIASCVGSSEDGRLANTEEVKKSGQAGLNDHERRKEPSGSALTTAGTESMDTADGVCLPLRRNP